MENGLLHQEDEAKFLETAVIFSHHAAEFLRNHRTYIANDESMVVQLEYILRYNNRNKEMSCKVADPKLHESVTCHQFTQPRTDIIVRT